MLLMKYNIRVYKYDDNVHHALILEHLYKNNHVLIPCPFRNDLLPSLEIKFILCGVFEVGLLCLPLVVLLYLLYAHLYRKVN